MLRCASIAFFPWELLWKHSMFAISQNWHQSARHASIASADLLVGAFDNATAQMCNSLGLPYKRYSDLETKYVGVCLRCPSFRCSNR